MGWYTWFEVTILFYMNLDIYKKKLKEVREKGRIMMCDVLRNIHGKSADDILEMCGAADEIPISLNRIMKFLKISAIPFDFSEIEAIPEIKAQVDTKGEILGAVVIKDDKAGIFYRESDSNNRQRFTIAHELAHCCLDTVDFQNGHLQFRMENDKEPSEFAANTFAGELLVPESKLREFIKRVPDITAIMLADIFNVSESVMNERLRILNIKL